MTSISSNNATAAGLWRLPATVVMLIVIALGLAIPRNDAHAQEPKKVAAGQSIIIARTLAAPTVTSPTAKGAHLIVQPVDAKNWTILYLAPTSPNEFTEDITYTVNGTATTVKITVTQQAPTLQSEGIYTESFKAIFVLFVVALLLESGLAVLFNWRPFVQLFDSRGVKTIVSVAFALFFVSVFDLDIVTSLVNVYLGTHHPVGFPGKFVTALVIAGGSAGVNRLLVGLGFRSVVTAAQASPAPAPTQAWISVRLIRDRAVGPVTVLLGTAAGPLNAIGTITGSSSTSSFLRYFLRDFGRFPPSGGSAITPVAGATYRVQLMGTDSHNGSVPSDIWGPYPIEVKAIIDIELKA